MPKETHPMTLFSQAVLALQNGSVFAQKYHSMKKDVYWEAALEDSLDLTAKLPVIAAYIYRMKYFGENKKPKYNPKQDYGLNFARMMKVSDRKGYAELARLYFILHSDHESGNVSAHTMHLVGSALSDPYLSFSAALNGLAGPLHGLANQECLAWLIEVKNKFGGVPTRDASRHVEEAHALLVPGDRGDAAPLVEPVRRAGGGHRRHRAARPGAFRTGYRTWPAGDSCRRTGSTGRSACGWAWPRTGPWCPR